jgi:tetratricopeptide (TPR) repeat protein
MRDGNCYGNYSQFYEDALATHRAVLAAREALAAEPGAGVVAKVDIGRSLIAVGGLLEATGKTDEALASYRRSESLLAGPAGVDPSARAALAACRSQMGGLLRATGKSADALASYRLARADQEALADAPQATNDARHDLADTVRRMGVLLEATGKPAEAEVEYRRALALYQKLADANPSVIDFRDNLSSEYLRVAARQAWFGQDNELSSTCQRLLSLAKDLEDPSLADRAARCCSLRQADPKRCEAALVLARRAVEHGKGSQWLVYFEMTLGMAEYRSGHFAEADVALTAAMNDPGKSDAVSSTSALYRAMGLFRQGKTDLARELATEAAAKMKPLPVGDQKPLAGGAAATDDLIMWLAYKEAKAMIQFDATRAAAAQPHTK